MAVETPGPAPVGADPAARRSPILEVEGLRVGYGPILALRDVSLHVAHGEVVAIVGANGAGKTTLLRALSNLLTHRRGTVRYDGAPTAKWPPHRLARAGLVHVPEGRGLFRGQTVLENLQIAAEHAGRAREAEATLALVFELFPRLLERRAQLAGSMSGGEQQMLALGKALMSRPRLLMLDEPSMGLAPVLVTEVFELIGRLRRQGLSILLVEQNARKALELADRGYVLVRGEVALEGTAAELSAREELLHAYLGGKPAGR